MYRKCHSFLHFLLPVLKANQPKTLVFYSVLTRQHAKNTMFETLFHIFSAHAPPFKIRSFFTLLLPPLIRTQEGVKSGQIAKLHLNSTFCLSQSLPHSCNTKNWGRLSGPQMLYITVFYEHTMHCTCKKRCPPPAKADCVSASGKTRFFCTYGAGGFVARAVRKRSG